MADAPARRRRSSAPTKVAAADKPIEPASKPSACQAARSIAVPASSTKPSAVS
ncbi:MAG TPA: hypothetical protein VG755_37085 [Nannocystaceae bacterium]|nr:hypothetical protein [Nannocystaceae bacterium]